MNHFRFMARLGLVCALAFGSSKVKAQSAASSNGAPDTKVGATGARSLRTGIYTCGSIMSGSIAGSTTGMTIGQITLLGPSVYTSLVKEGTGSKSSFTYEQATGKIKWEGGRLAGFFGKIVESRYSLDNRGKPVIRVTYRVREGGNLFDLSCQ